MRYCAVHMIRTAFDFLIVLQGVDLSPHMLAVARHTLASRPSNAHLRNVISYKHAAAEDTGLAAGSYDLVCLCLVSVCMQ
jgi:ubiquinone/menaquinone biosynthesis C-methylase UbiE